MWSIKNTKLQLLNLKNPQFIFKNSLFRVRGKNVINIMCQCLTVGQWMSRYPFLHYSALFLCSFFSIWLCHIILFLFSTFFILCSFDVALFWVALILFYTLYKLHISILLFLSHFFSCCTYSMVCFLHVALFSYYIFMMLL